MGAEDQLSLGDEFARARRTDPLTSHEAAASVLPEKIRASQAAVMVAFEFYGAMTDTELVKNYGDLRSVVSVGASKVAPPPQSPSGLRTRRKELVAKGKLRNSGKKKVIHPHRAAIVWEVVR